MGLSYKILNQPLGSVVLVGAKNYMRSIISAQEWVILDDNNVPTGMTRWENIKDILNGNPFTVIIRSITREFWKLCIQQSKKYRVCAIGTPGIGKSTSIPVLIRMLLAEG